MSRCGYIIPPNLYPKTCPEKEVDTPTKKHSSATHCCKSDGGNRGKDGERGKVTFFPECVRSPKEVRSFTLVLWRGHGMDANVRL
jgi:hypothetical protein